MKVALLCPQWGQEHLPMEALLIKVKDAGFDGIDTWVPPRRKDRQQLLRLLADYDLVMVSHQHQASGTTLATFCESFDHHLNLSLETQPLFITSHSGRDYFTLDEQLQVIDTAAAFAERHKVRVVHETHRGRLGGIPVVARELFRLRPDYRLTADLSHWVCVSESYLDGFGPELAEAIHRADHIHARVGFPQGPQIPDPFLPEWQEALQHFLGWWDNIVETRWQAGAEYITITPECGPPPYMWTVNGQPVIDQWTVNVAMKNLLRDRYGQHK